MSSNRVEQYATFEQYETLAKMLTHRGVMPADLAAVCRLLYRRDYPTLSHDNAEDLLKRISQVPSDQYAMRSWIATTTDLLAGQWVKGVDA